LWLSSISVSQCGQSAPPEPRHPLNVGVADAVGDLALWRPQLHRARFSGQPLGKLDVGFDTRRKRNVERRTKLLDGFGP